MTDVTPAVVITVRFFAAASAAAGAETAELTLPAGATVADAVDELRAQSTDLANVLNRCSYLCDGYAVRDPNTVLAQRQTLDVLPPFAGG